MTKRAIISIVLFALFLGALTALAEEPKQNIENSKGFASINYDRQDSEQTGIQKIINDHSAFNINIQIIKKGALFSEIKNKAVDKSK